MKSFFCLLLVSLAISGVAIAQDQPPAKPKPPAPAARGPMPENPGPAGPGGGGMMCPCGHMMQGGPGMGPAMGPGMGPGTGMMMGRRMRMMGPAMGPGQERDIVIQRFGRGGPPPMREGRRFGRGQRGFGPMGGPGAEMSAERMRRELNLTDQQVSRLRQMDVERQKKAIRTRADLETRELDLHELLRADSPDRAAVDAKINEIGTLRTQMMKDGMDARLALMQVLTPEQKQKMRQQRERGAGEKGPAKAAPKPPRPPE